MDRSPEEPKQPVFAVEPAGCYCSVCTSVSDTAMVATRYRRVCRRCLAHARDLFERPVIRRPKR